MNNNFVKSFDRKREITDEESLQDSESFETRDSELKQLDHNFVETFDRKSKSTGEKALPDSEIFGTKDSEMRI